MHIFASFLEGGLSWPCFGCFHRLKASSHCGSGRCHTSRRGTRQNTMWFCLSHSIIHTETGTLRIWEPWMSSCRTEKKKYWAVSQVLCPLRFYAIMLDLQVCHCPLCHSTETSARFLDLHIPWWIVRSAQLRLVQVRQLVAMWAMQSDWTLNPQGHHSILPTEMASLFTSWRTADKVDVWMFFNFDETNENDKAISKNVVVWETERTKDGFECMCCCVVRTWHFM